MTFEEYVMKQRNTLMRRHAGEEFLIINGEVLPLRPADEILSDMASMEGLVKGRVSRTAGGAWRASVRGGRECSGRRAAAV